MGLMIHGQFFPSAIRYSREMLSFVLKEKLVRGGVAWQCELNETEID